MPQDYYSDSDSADQTTTMPDEGSDKESADANMEQVATLPKSICPGMEAGEELVLRIDKVLEDEYLVSYAPGKGSEKPESKSEDMGEEMMAPPSKSSSMYE